MSDFFVKLGMLSDKKLDCKCSNCKRKFRAKCNAASHIAQSSCKRMSATVLFIGFAYELLRAQPIIEADESIKNIPNIKKDIQAKCEINGWIECNFKKCPPVGILRWTILDKPPRTLK